MKFISQKPINLIKNLTLFIACMTLSFYALCDTSNLKSLKTGTLLLANGKSAKLFVAENDEQQLKGLSGVQSDEFADDHALLFLYPHDGPRRFWMPDTYFNLDIFFLDAQGNVQSISRNMMAHPGTEEILIPIAKTPVVSCRNVLEMKASSPLSKSIKVGDKLKWTFPSSRPGKEPSTRQKQ